MPVQSQRRRDALLTTVLVGATFLVSLDLFIVNVAFDEIGHDLASGGASLADVSWVLTTYAVVYAALLVPMGRLTDRYGRKNGFVAGLVVFTLASAACGFAGSVWQLVGFRALQAIGAAALTPASLGLLLAALPEVRRRPRPGCGRSPARWRPPSGRRSAAAWCRSRGSGPSGSTSRWVSR